MTRSHVANYYRYWAKARPGYGRGASCHLLPYHNLDVAAVGWRLLSSQRPWAGALAQHLAIPLDQLRCLLVFMLGLHDIGKFARAFQGLAQPMGADLVPPLRRYEYTVRHDQLGANAMYARLGRLHRRFFAADSKSIVRVGEWRAPVE